MAIRDWIQGGYSKRQLKKVKPIADKVAALENIQPDGRRIVDERENGYGTGLCGRYAVRPGSRAAEQRRGYGVQPKGRGCFVCQQVYGGKFHAAKARHSV